VDDETPEPGWPPGAPPGLELLLVVFEPDVFSGAGGADPLLEGAVYPEAIEGNKLDRRVGPPATTITPMLGIGAVCSKAPSVYEYVPLVTSKLIVEEFELATVPLKPTDQLAPVGNPLSSKVTT
jgi:hypothetical protein